MNRSRWVAGIAAAIASTLFAPATSAQDYVQNRPERLFGEQLLVLPLRSELDVSHEPPGSFIPPITNVRPMFFGELPSVLQTRFRGPDNMAEESFNCGQIPGSSVVHDSGGLTSPDAVGGLRKVDSGSGPGGMGGGFGGGKGGGPGGGGPPGYDGAWYPSSAVQGQNATLGFFRQGLNLGAPVWQNGEDKIMAIVSVRNTIFSTDAILPDTGRPFPEQLWNVNLGMNYKHQFENGWTGMLTLGVGSASDKPFNSINEMNAKVLGFVKIPVVNGRDNWQLGLMYNAGGQLNFPIPLIAYGWNPSERLRMNIGMPCSVFWQPADDWTVNITYMPLLNINAKVNYRVAPKVQLYCGYEYVSETYSLADRIEKQDRFFSLEQRVVTGVQWEVWKGTLDINGGYSFSRRYGEGDDQWSTLKDQVNVDPGLFLGVSYRLRF